MLKNFSISFVLQVLFLSVLLTGCDPEDENNEGCEPRPLDCVTTEYTSGTLSIQVTINSENPAVTINIFRGNVEDSDLVDSVNATSENYSTTLPIGNYSGRVEYKSGEDTIAAIDGDSIANMETLYCEGYCYELENAELDLRFDQSAYTEHKEGDDERCFIATAAFGSSFTGEIATLKDFRDRFLMRSTAGRIFVDAYYHYSPPIAQFIKEYKPAGFVVRSILIPVVILIRHPFLSALFILLYISLLYVMVSVSAHKAEH